MSQETTDVTDPASHGICSRCALPSTGGTLTEFHRDGHFCAALCSSCLHELHAFMASPAALRQLEDEDIAATVELVMADPADLEIWQ